MAMYVVEEKQEEPDTKEDDDKIMTEYESVRVSEIDTDSIKYAEYNHTIYMWKRPIVALVLLGLHFKMTNP